MFSWGSYPGCALPRSEVRLLLYTEATELRPMDGGDDDTTGVPPLYVQLHSPPYPLN
jgi:hypothetical protein